MTASLRRFTGVLILTLAPLAWTADTMPCKAEPDDVFQGMSFKLVRGITNVVTSPAELPKQIYRTTRDMGAPGVAVGVVKGLSMFIYRAVTGAVETVLFPVPEPGFYESLTRPTFVWQGWYERTPAIPRGAPKCR